uniref:Uncharacterized protein n=1 Tax=Parastrongyloides trichosuri TaxID=131310 RepID=A0A0N4Z3Y9_PARTI
MSEKEKKIREVLNDNEKKISRKLKKSEKEKKRKVVKLISKKSIEKKKEIVTDGNNTNISLHDKPSIIEKIDKEKNDIVGKSNDNIFKVPQLIPRPTNILMRSRTSTISKQKSNSINMMEIAAKAAMARQQRANRNSISKCDERINQYINENRGNSVSNMVNDINKMTSTSNSGNLEEGNN